MVKERILLNLRKGKMNIYRLVFLILIVFFIFEEYLKKKKEIYKTTKFLSVFILILVAGLRSSNVIDGKMYFNIFKNVPSLFDLTIEYLKKERVENGYVILNSIVKLFTENYHWAFFIVATITLINLYFFINYFSEAFFCSLIFYYTRWFYLKEYSQSRNALACSFFYVGLIFLEKKKYYKYCLLVILGGMFHKSIFFCLTFPVFKYFFEQKNYEKIYRKIIYLLIFILPLINTKEILNKILIKYNLVKKAYLTGYYSSRKTYIGVFYSLGFLLIILFLNKKLKQTKKYEFLKSIYVYSVFITSSLFYYGDITGRLSSFFNVEFLLQDKILKIYKNKTLIKILMILFLIFLYKLNVVNRLENIILKK